MTNAQDPLSEKRPTSDSGSRRGLGRRNRVISKQMLIILLLALFGGGIAFFSVIGSAACAEAGSTEPAPKGPVDAYGDPLPLGAIARIGTLRLRHPGSSSASLAFSPDGKRPTDSFDYRPKEKTGKGRHK